MAVRAQQFYPALGQDAFLFQLHGQVQARLAADARQDGVGPLKADDLGNIFQGQGFHVHFVGHAGIGHDGGRVGVAEDDLIAFFFQGQAGLGACIVKLGGLPDDDGAGADDEYFFNICSFRHGAYPLPPSCG